MKIVRETYDQIVEEYCYLITTINGVWFIQTYSKWSINMFKKEWDTLENSKDVSLCESFSLSEFNKTFFTGFTSLKSLTNNFIQLSHYDFTDFFLHLSNRYLAEFASVKTNKYLQVIAQTAFGNNFLKELILDTTPINNHKGAIGMSLNEQGETFIIGLGVVNETPPYSTEVKCYAFRKPYLKHLFNEKEDISIDFCLVDLSDREFINKVFSYYERRIFVNNQYVNKKLKGYLRKKKIDLLLT